MGKSNRRKRRQKQKQTSGDASEPRNPSSATHQLRHPDPKIRHGALVALQANFLHDHSKSVNLQVLQAVREQVMDSDMNCASAAAECLAQHVSYADGDTHKDVMASWTLILIGRLDQCLQALQSTPSNSKQWYALAAPCLRALCKLIEMNELALEQMNAQKQTFLSTVFGLLEASANHEATLDQRHTEWVEETGAFAARCIHSSIEDNFEMVNIINGNEKVMELWPTLMSKLPDVAALHVAGCVVALYQAAPSKWQIDFIMTKVLPCLSKSMVVNAEGLKTLEENLGKANQLWMTQKQDDKMEKEILQKIAKKRESARDIARRLKQTTRDGKAVMNEQEDGRQAVEDSLTAWNNTIMPLQLALEVMANLLSCLVQDEDEMALERDSSLDSLLHQELLKGKVAEHIVGMLQTICVHTKSRANDEHDLLKDDLQEAISKVSACIANSVISKVLLEADFAATWNVLRQHPSERGVCSVMAALVQNSKSLRELAVHDLEIFQNMLHNSDEDVQRDAVCLISAAMARSTPENVVINLTNELIKVMNTAPDTVKCEALNTIMELYGDDDFHPRVFSSLGTLDHYKKCVMSVPQKGLSPEEEEILFNANRFVEYKES
ncbi:unnamed protein product [Cylindrotheca closterium]|uniref:Uncharacterized protein n=1 Tax=Cylindrotheca closterium TaxID=2856 RepID=A0AAD2G3V5_9STRA|nr:unnamed protein product [Cylindrotheca closterium]